MSLLVDSAHGYEAIISGWAAGLTKAWAFAWFKTSDGSAHRGIVQITQNLFDGTQDYLSLDLDGSIVLAASVSTANVDQTTPDPAAAPTLDPFYMWNSAQTNRWTVGCAILDTTQTTADLKIIYGRAAATAKAATQLVKSLDLAATSAALTRIRVLADRRKVIFGSAVDDTSMSTIKASYIAVGQGNVPSQAQIQACIDGTHPADLPGAWEYWDLTSSGAGLVGAKRGITLVPFGGAATTTWDGADNPTVSAPTAPPVDLSGTATLDGSTVSGGLSSNPPSTLTGTATLDDITAGGALGVAPGRVISEPLKTNQGVLQANVALNYYALYNDVTGVLVLRKTGISTNASGIVDFTDPAIQTGVIYKHDWETVTGERRMPRKAAA